MAPDSRVCILLCTLHGQRFLQDQLRSIEGQTFENWTLCASDDGSADQTLAMLQELSLRLPNRVAISKGPGRGFAANFLSAATSPSLPPSAYYAFCDQDDIWEPHKLKSATDWLSSIEPHVPAVYASRTQLIDETGIEIGMSPLFQRPPSFANALVQNIGGGNTMVFNEAARRLLVQAGSHVQIPSHDWWLYLLTSACGGRIFYDPLPSVRYRQHGRNQSGSNKTLPARIKRARMLLSGHLKHCSELHIAALRPFVNQMTDENRRIFEEFCHSRTTHALDRVARLRRIGVRRQSTVDNLGLFVAALSRRL